MAVSDWASAAQAAGKQYGIDPNLLLAMASVESSGNPDAVSPQGAIGPLQLMPKTAKALGVSDPTNPNQAFPAAAKLLIAGRNQFGSPEGAVLSYHGGTNQAAWGPKTHAYLQKVSDAYSNLKNGNSVASSNAQPQDISDQDLLSAITGGVTANSNTPSAPAKPSGVNISDQDLMAAITGGNSATSPATAKSAAQTNKGWYQNLSEGTLQGLNDVIKTVSSPLNYLDKIDGLDALHRLIGVPTSDQMNNAYTKNTAAFNAQNGQSTSANVGRALGQIAGSIPALSAAGGIIGPIAEGISSAVPAAEPAINFLSGSATGNKLIQLGSKAALGALQGGAASALTSSASNEPFWQQVKSGAEFGAAAAPVASLAYDAGSGLVNKLTGGGISPERAALAQKAVEDYGIPLRGSQISNSPFMKLLDSNIGKVPFSGLEAQNEEQAGAFSKAVASTFGADDLTQEGMSAAKSRIGKVFNDVGGRTTIQDASNIISKIENVIDEASQALPENEVTPLSKQLANISSTVDPETNSISGKTYKALISDGSPLDRAMNAQDSNVRFYAGKIKDALDDGLEASAEPEDVSALRNARWQYKNMKTVQNLAAKAGPEGDISPTALQSAVLKSFKNAAYTGAGDLGDLANIGKQFMSESPSSSTAERLTMFKLLGLGAGGGAADALLMHDPNALMHAATGGIGLLGASKAIGAGLQSNLYRNMLLRGAQQSPGLLSEFASSPAGQSLLSSGAQYAIPAATIGRNALLQNQTPPAINP